MWSALFFLTACVSKGSYELVEVQLDATRIALSARNAACYQDGLQRDASFNALEQELSRVQQEHHQLEDRYKEQNHALEQLQLQLAGLVTKPGEEGEPPMVDATLERVQAALVNLERSEFVAGQQMERYYAWEQRFAALEGEGKLSLISLAGEVVVRIPTKMLFNEGQLTLSPRGEELMKELLAVLASAKDEVILVESHTDSQPFHTAEFNSSWELGFAQAMMMVRALEGAGIGRSLSASTAAGTRPIADNTAEEGRDQNRRIEITLRHRVDPPRPEEPPELP